MKNGDGGSNADGSNANDDGTEAGKAKGGDGANGAAGTEREPHVHPTRERHSHGASKNHRRASAGAIGTSLSKYLNSFAPTARGDMFSPLSHACFDPSIAGIEGVIALEHGLIMAQEAAFSHPASCSSRRFPRGICPRVSPAGLRRSHGAPAERMVGTSLIAGLHAEDIRNLVFAFHLFPTILPEIECEKGKDGERESKDGGEGVGAGMMPAPNSVRLLPHGFLRRRHISGAFVSMERLGASSSPTTRGGKSEKGICRGRARSREGRD